MTRIAPEAAALRARKAYILRLLRNRPGEPHALADIRQWIRDVDAHLARTETTKPRSSKGTTK